MPRDIHNVNIQSMLPLVSPRDLKSSLPLDERGARRVVSFRDEVVKIISHDDDRLLVIIGPCSIHDTDAAMDYARRLKNLRDRYADSMCLVMRVYFEKPRTSLGWRGLIVDPRLDGSYAIDEGLREARRLLLEITSLGVPVGTEVLDPIIPQYIADMVSWAAIGARTTESQTHRELSSGLSMAVGFKNGTDGDLSKAVNAVRSAQQGHSFIGIDQEGRTSIFKTHGNRTGHIIMRGGNTGPNYYEEDIEKAEDLLSDIGVNPSIIIDCSHANSGKRPERQSRVLRAAMDMRERERSSVRGVMLESNIAPGRQDIGADTACLTYGQSLTDACIGWEESADLLEAAARRFAKH